MAAFKQFNTNEVVITPFHANKGFRFAGDAVTASDVGIEYYQSFDTEYVSGSRPTGFTTRLDQVLVFNNIKQLYYSNYLTRSTGDPVTTQSLILGANGDEDSNQFVGPITGPRYDNYLQTSQTQSRFFALYSQSNKTGPSVISIPSKLYGEMIPPSTFEFEYTSSQNQTRSFVVDDGEGNLMATYNSGEARPGVSDPTLQEKVGDIFYSQGIAIFTQKGSGSLSFLGKDVQGAANPNALTSQSIAFSSSITIKENQYKCVVRDNEYSYTLNPSALRPIGELSKASNQLSGSINLSTYNDGGNPGTYEIEFENNTGVGAGVGQGGVATVIVASDGTVSDITVSNSGRGYVVEEGIFLNMNVTSGTGLLFFSLTVDDITNIASPTGLVQANETYYDFATGSYFSPYVTTIGLYNEAYQLVAVGKLSQALPISLNTDTTFVVNFDTW